MQDDMMDRNDNSSIKQKEANEGHLSSLFSELEEEEEQHRTILRDLVLPPHMLVRRGDEDDDGESDDDDDDLDDSDDDEQPRSAAQHSQYYFDPSTAAQQHPLMPPNYHVENNDNTAIVPVGTNVVAGKLYWSQEMTEAIIAHYAKHLSLLQPQHPTATTSSNNNNNTAGSSNGSGTLAHRTWKIIAKDLAKQFPQHTDGLSSKSCKNKFVKLKHEYLTAKLVEREKHNMALHLYNERCSNNSNGENNVVVSFPSMQEVLTSSRWEARKRELLQMDAKLKRFLEPSYRFAHTDTITAMLPDNFAEAGNSSLGVKKADVESGSVHRTLPPPAVQDDNVRRRFARQHAKISKEVKTIVESLQESLKTSLADLQKLLGVESELLQNVSLGLVQQPWALFHQRALPAVHTHMLHQQHQQPGQPLQQSGPSSAAYLTAAEMELLSQQHQQQQAQLQQHHQQQQQQQHNIHHQQQQQQHHQQQPQFQQPQAQHQAQPPQTQTQQQLLLTPPPTDPSLSFRSRALLELRSSAAFAPLLASYEDCDLIFSKVLHDDNAAFAFLVFPDEHKLHFLMDRLNQVKHLQRVASTAANDPGNIGSNKRQRK